ncbi:choice-of-anchor B family protein [Rhodocaloribacter litoris]|uniref:choice-of-anchor B family protein n=1 Tax=Rhodocaloribacter litoris TaxID=2558931 RepID=UPI001E34291F|nr:choice-of-anchor B family protein [Rhodocaloribacter litoris]QXD14008.1 choice-of-anchor B family protein [Rhodocaloribacter litoris]
MNRLCTLYLALFLLAGFAAQAQTLRSEEAGDPARRGFGGAVAAGNDEVFVGEPMNTATPGYTYVFRRNEDGTWSEAARLEASDAVEGDRFGAALALDGNHLLVGAPNQNQGAGAAYVFRRDAAGNWTEVARLAIADGGSFGGAVALSGDVAFIGAEGYQDDTGAVFVFRRSGDAWVPQDTLTGEAPGGHFGAALALDGDLALVGAPRQEDNLGAVYFFRFENGTWTAGGRLPADGLEGDARFGSSIGLQDGYALVGAPRFQRFSGTVLEYAFDAEEGTWVRQGMLVPFDAAPQTRFGTAVDVDGDEVWVGGPGADRFSGAVYRFERDPRTGTWRRVHKLKSDEAGNGDFFAATLDVRGNLAVVGSVGDDGGEGTATVFERDAQGQWHQQAIIFSEVASFASITGGQVNCSDGAAADFGCGNVDLLSFLSVKDIGGGRGTHLNDVWGWTDPETGREYALVGRNDGTSFVDISDPVNPVYLGDLPLHEGARPAAWRDIKVYRNHAFIVADGAGPHGMQVFDLTRLRSVENPPVTFTEDAHYDRINSAHNIVINEETGFAYTVGGSMGGETCGGGLHMIDLREPKNPQFAGCFSHTGTGRQGTGYTHDAQCVVYRGPDAEHRGKEICFGANETALSIADVTDKANPKALSQASYPNVGYTHQGWLTEDQHYFYVNDELDELQGKVAGTRTLIWDVSDLDDPQLLREYVSENKASDHNLYIRGNLMYQSNYVAGLRIFDITNRENPALVGHFDTVPYGEDAPGFNGSWSNYPFFKSGTIVVTSMREGVFMLKKKDVDL